MRFLVLSHFVRGGLRGRCWLGPLGVGKCWLGAGGGAWYCTAAGWGAVSELVLLGNGEEEREPLRSSAGDVLGTKSSTES